MKEFKSKLREVTAVYKSEENISNVKIGSSRDVNDYIRSVWPVSIDIRETIILFINKNCTLSNNYVSLIYSKNLLSLYSIRHLQSILNYSGSMILKSAKS